MTMIEYVSFNELTADKKKSANDNSKNDYALHIKTHSQEEMQLAAELAGNLSLA